MGKRRNSHSNRVKANHSRMRAITEGVRMRRLEAVCSRMTEAHDEPLEKYGLSTPPPTRSLLICTHTHTITHVIDWTAGALAALRGEVLPKSEDESGMSDEAVRAKAVCVVEEDKGDDMADVVEVKDEPVDADDVAEVPARAEKAKKQGAKKKAAAAAEKEDVVMVDEDAEVKAAPKKAKKAGAKKAGSKKTGDKLIAGKKSVTSADAARRKPRTALRK